jgi:hypothetical protein
LFGLTGFNARRRRDAGHEVSSVKRRRARDATNCFARKTEEEKKRKKVENFVVKMFFCC